MRRIVICVLFLIPLTSFSKGVQGQEEQYVSTMARPRSFCYPAYSAPCPPPIVAAPAPAPQPAKPQSTAPVFPYPQRPYHYEGPEYSRTAPSMSEALGRSNQKAAAAAVQIPVFVPQDPPAVTVIQPEVFLDFVPSPYRAKAVTVRVGGEVVSDLLTNDGWLAKVTVQGNATAWWYIPLPPDFGITDASTMEERIALAKKVGVIVNVEADYEEYCIQTTRTMCGGCGSSCAPGRAALMQTSYSSSRGPRRLIYKSALYSLETKARLTRIHREPVPEKEFQYVVRYRELTVLGSAGYNNIFIANLAGPRWGFGDYPVRQGNSNCGTCAPVTQCGCGQNPCQCGHHGRSGVMHAAEGVTVIVNPPVVQNVQPQGPSILSPTPARTPAPGTP